ncbi:MAG: hypothetical protein LBK05_07225, partial [Treponema sp.]|nr:hypothetical protein [Treponema sp.]
SVFGTASLDLGEKPGRTLVRFDRFFQEPGQNQPGFGTGSNFFDFFDFVVVSSSIPYNYTYRCV